MYNIDCRFVTKFMHVFCITAFYIFIRFGRDDFGIYFLWCRHSYHFFVSVVRFVSLLSLMLLFLLQLLLLMFVLVVRFYVVCVVADMAVVLPDVSGFLLETVDFCLMLLVFWLLLLSFDVFGSLFDVAAFLVVGSGVSADVMGVPADAVSRFVEGFAAVLRPPHSKLLLLLSLVFHFLFQPNVNYHCSKDSYLTYHLLSIYGLWSMVYIRNIIVIHFSYDIFYLNVY